MVVSRFFSQANRPVSVKRNVVTLFILLSVASVLFGAVLLTSQKYADGDEAVVGIMAKHILTKGEHPLFFYGQVYGGGGAIEAYLAAIPIAVFGTSAIALKSVAVFFWLLTIALCYKFCLRRYDYTTAVVSSVILMTATALIEWHLKMRGGYAALPMLFMMILMCFCNLIEKGSGRSRQFLLFGLLCGVAYYNLEIVLPFLFTLLLASLFRRHIFWKWKTALLTVAGFIIGASPLVIFNLTHEFINIKYVFGQGAGQEGQNLFSNLYALVIEYLPGFFSGRNVDKYIDNPPITAYLEYAVYFMLFVFLIIKIWPQVKKTVVSLLSPAGAKENDSPADIEIFLVAYMIIHSIVFSVSGKIGSSPRYLLPLYPALAIVAARGVGRLCTEKNRVFKVTGIILMIALVAFGAVNNAANMGRSRVNDDVLVTGQTPTNRETRGDTISKMIGFLNKRQVTRVWCTYFVQWRLIFESDEKIIASSYQLIPGGDTIRYPLYDTIVWEQRGPQAIILHREDRQLALLLEQSATDGYEREEIGEYSVLLPKGQKEGI